MADGVKTIYLCESCGGRMWGKVQFCRDCKTPDSRKAMKEANAKVWEENEGKGFVNPSKIINKQ